VVQPDLTGRLTGRYPWLAPAGGATATATPDSAPGVDFRSEPYCTAINMVVADVPVWADPAPLWTQANVGVVWVDRVGVTAVHTVLWLLTVLTGTARSARKVML
jgi:hypothetical protein